MSRFLLFHGVLHDQSMLILIRDQRIHMVRDLTQRTLLGIYKKKVMVIKNVHFDVRRIQNEYDQNHKEYALK